LDHLLQEPCISTVQSWPYSRSYSSSYFSSYLLFLSQKCNFFFRVKSSPSEMSFCTLQSILSHILQAIIAWPGVGGLNVMISRSSKWSTLKPLPGQFSSRRLVGEQKCFLRFKRPRRWFYRSVYVEKCYKFVKNYRGKEQ
jgi:hypothetical protein